MLFASVVSAQVQLGLSLLPDGKTYQVSMTPETTWLTPMNTTGSAQVVVAVPIAIGSSEAFLVKDLKSQVPGVNWLDDSYVENPPAAPGWTFISFTIKELGTKAIPFEAGVETPLFTFSSATGDCAEGLLLLDNGDPLVQAVVKNKFNVTQNLTVLGMRGNAVTGIGASKIECPEAPVQLPETWISKVIAGPIPAATWVDLAWVNGEGLETLDLQLLNEQGQIIKQHKLSTKPGAQKFHAEVDNMAHGIYSVTFIANGKQKETVRLVVMP